MKRKFPIEASFRKLGIFISTHIEWNIPNPMPPPFGAQVLIFVHTEERRLGTKLSVLFSICRFFTHGKMSTSRWTRLVGRTFNWIQLGIATRRHYISISLVFNLFVVLFFFLLFSWLAILLCAQFMVCGSMEFERKVSLFRPQA